MSPEADEVSSHPSRFAQLSIAETVHELPGIHLRELARVTGHSPGTTFARVGDLTRSGRVEAVRDGRYLRFFDASDAIPQAERELICAFWSPIERGTMALLLRDGTSTQRAIASALGVTTSAVSPHVRRLVARGILSAASYRMGVNYRLTDPAATAAILERLGPRVPPSFEIPSPEPGSRAAGTR